jgi:hypothetical protein
VIAAEQPSTLAASSQWSARACCQRPVREGVRRALDDQIRQPLRCSRRTVRIRCMGALGLAGAQMEQFPADGTEPRGRGLKQSGHDCDQFEPWGRWSWRSPSSGAELASCANLTARTSVNCRHVRGAHRAGLGAARQCPSPGVPIHRVHLPAVELCQRGAIPGSGAPQGIRAVLVARSRAVRTDFACLACVS